MSGQNSTPEHDIQLEPPQATIRAEVPTGNRDGRKITWGELRVFLHAVAAIFRKQVDASSQITAYIDRLSAAHTDAEGWLKSVELTETRTWKADLEAYQRHHRVGTDEDDVILARRRRIEPWMYYALACVLIAADFLFFLTLWRDVEEADKWMSVETLQAVIYALITPAVLTVIAVGLGRVAATYLRKGDEVGASDRKRLILLGVPGVLAVLVIVFAVNQRIDMLENVESGVPLNSMLFYLLFIILPLGLGVVEVLRQDEVVVLDETRTAASSAAGDHVESVIAEGTRLHRIWTTAHHGAVELQDVLQLEMNDPLHAAADLIAQERAHHGHDGSYAELLWQTQEGAVTGSSWVNTKLPQGSLDPVIDGPMPRINLERLGRLCSAIAADQPPTIASWLVRIEQILKGESGLADGETGVVVDTVAESIEPLDDEHGGKTGTWPPNWREELDDVIGETDSDAEEQP